MVDSGAPDEKVIHELTSEAQLAELVNTGVRVALNCWAPWAPPCAQTNTIHVALHKKYLSPTYRLHPVIYATLEPEKHPTVMKKYDISTVPTFLYFSASRLVRRQTGADPAALARNAEWLVEVSEDTLLDGACETVIRSADVVLAMKGTPDTPRCGFSRQVVDLLRTAGVVFSAVDVLADPGLRESLKRVAQWPTYPMVFARGELVGGIDIIRQLSDERKLVERISGVPGADAAVVEAPSAPPAENKYMGQGELPDKLRERLTELVKRERVMLFMKGSPESPRCGFSRRTVELLRGQGVEYGHFDILQDNDVRQGLKTFSDWPTFPQLYARGQFVGGLDIIAELIESGDFRDEIGMEA